VYVYNDYGIVFEKGDPDGVLVFGHGAEHLAAAEMELSMAVGLGQVSCG
jgi:hypothetical protein